MKHALLLPIAILAFLFSYGQTINTDRPTQAASPIVLPKGAFQIEAGGIAAMATIKNDDNYKEFLFAVPTTTFRYSILKGVEIRLAAQIDYYKIEYRNFQFGNLQDNSEIGLRDLEVGFKFQLLNSEDRQLKLGWLTHIGIPTGSEGFSAESFGVANRLLITHKVGNSFTLGSNLGHVYFEEGFHQVFASISGTIKLSKEISFFIEPYINAREGFVDKHIDYTANINGGFIFLASDKFQVDLSLGSNLNTENQSFFLHTRFISAGVSWLIQKKK